MSIIFYDKAVTEEYPELTDAYRESDKWVTFFIGLSWIFIVSATALLYHPYILSAIGGGILALLSILCYRFFKGGELFRIVAALTLVIFAIIFIQANFGMVETHLYFFAAMTVFLLYYDTKPLHIAVVGMILYYLFAYKLQAINTEFFGIQVILFEPSHYAFSTLMLYLFFLIVEWGIIYLVIRNARQNFLDSVDDSEEIFEKYKELQIFDALYESTNNGVLVTTHDGVILSANKAFEGLTGYTEEYLIGKNPRVLKSQKHNNAFYVEMWRTLESKHRFEGEIWNRCRDGRTNPFWLDIRAIIDEGIVFHYVAVYVDLSEKLQADRKMSFMAHHDALTQLPNRESFNQQLKHAIYLAKSDKQHLALLSIDLDRFKIINDTMGHNIGDELIKEVANSLKNILKESDILARPGGDEFLVLLEHIRSENEAAMLASNIADLFQHAFEIHGHTIHTSASIGIAIFPEDGEDQTTLMKAADSAMHQAKNKGKNSFEFFTSELSSRVSRSMKLENALHKAIDNKELFLSFQPQHQFETGKLISAEVLLRWDSKEFGSVPPDEFIPIAEESGLIIEIGEWVFRQSCKAVRAFKGIYPDLKHIAVNVSSEQFASYDIISRFPAIVKEQGIATSDIEIELTERSVMEQTETGNNVLQKLRSLGFKISVDDFGTGYSSMSYLKSLPIDVVKVDKSFIDGLPHDEGDTVIVKAILALIQNLGYETVAEGVEYKEQAEMLRDLGCDIAQGYLYSKPLTYSDFIDYIEQAMKTTR